MLPQNMQSCCISDPRQGWGASIGSSSLQQTSSNVDMICTAQQLRGQLYHLQLSHELILVHVSSRTNGLRHGVLNLLHLVCLLVDLIQHLQGQQSSSG